MQAYIEGQIFSGILDTESLSFTLESVKNIATESVLSKDQLSHLLNYLRKAQAGNNSVFITINDQIPLKLSYEEVEQLFNEISLIFDKVN